MQNPWLAIPLSDYEAHMALPQIGQATLLADLFEEALRTHAPASAALLGCAGGNGLERVPTDRPMRVVAVDLNPAYIEETRRRFGERLPGLEVHVSDVEEDEAAFEPVELVFAGLLFEYVDAAIALWRMREMLVAGGTLVAVLQMPCESQAEVSASPYTQKLTILTPLLRLVDPAELQRSATAAGFESVEARTVESAGGKRFRVQTLRVKE